jgi:hypothetical protein
MALKTVKKGSLPVTHKLNRVLPAEFLSAPYLIFADPRGWADPSQQPIPINIKSCPSIL